MIEKEVCWNYSEYSCKQQCSQPNPECHWIIQAKYDNNYKPSSLTKKITIEEIK